MCAPSISSIIRNACVLIVSRARKRGISLNHSMFLPTPGRGNPETGHSEASPTSPPVGSTHAQSRSRHGVQLSPLAQLANIGGVPFPCPPNCNEPLAYRRRRWRSGVKFLRRVVGLRNIVNEIWLEVAQKVLGFLQIVAKLRIRQEAADGMQRLAT